MIMDQIKGFLFEDATVKVVNGKRLINFKAGHMNSSYRMVDGKKVFESLRIKGEWWTEDAVDRILLKDRCFVFYGTLMPKHYMKSDGLIVNYLLIRVRSVDSMGKRDLRMEPASVPDNAGAGVEGDDLPF